jgi:hypothetical protein
MKKFLMGLAVSAVAMGAVAGFQQVGAQTAAADLFTGVFRVTGTDTDGRAYSDGLMRVSVYGDGFKTVWSGSRVVRGIGNYIGNTLGIAYIDEGVVGIAIYTTKDGGYTFDGYWQNENSPKEGTERLVYVPGT